MSGSALFVIREDGKIQCSGSNTYGEMGDINKANQYLANEIIDPSAILQAPVNIKKITNTANGSTYMIDSDGYVYVCGNNSGGQLGIGNTSSPISLRPLGKSALWGSNISQIIAHDDGALFLTNNGTIFGCGGNSYGQLATFNTTAYRTPTSAATFAGGNIKQIAMGSNFSLFLTQYDTIYVSGNGQYGQLGVGGTPVSTNPYPSNYPGDVKKVYASYLTSYAILKNGDLYGSGYNYFYNLGNGSQDNVLTPIKIMSNVSDIVATSTGCFAITTDKKLYAWGYNIYFDSNQHPIPIEIVGYSNVKQIDCTNASIIILTEDGKIYTAGNGTYNYTTVASTGKDVTNLFTSTPKSLSNQYKLIVSTLLSECLNITPVHMYTDKTKCVIRCKIGYKDTVTESDKYIKHKIDINGTNVVPYQSSYSIYSDFTIELPLSNFTNGNNTVKIQVINQTENDDINTSLTVKKEELYRLTSERTFLKIDGGYNTSIQVDKSNNKAIVIDNPNDGKKIPVSNCIDLWKEITSLSGNYPYNVVMIEFTRVDNMGVREVEVYSGSTKLTHIAKDYDPYVWHYDSKYGPLKLIDGNTIGGTSNFYYVNTIGPVNPYIVLSTSENLPIDMVKVYNGKYAGSDAYSTKVSIYGIYTETPNETITKTDSRWKLLKTVTDMIALAEPYSIAL